MVNLSLSTESSAVDVASRSPSNTASTSGSNVATPSASSPYVEADADLVTPDPNAAAAADAASGAAAASPLALLGISEEEVKEVKRFASKTGEYVSKGFSSFLSSVSQVSF